MSVWDRIALRDENGYVWLASTFFPEVGVRHRNARDRLIGRVIAELRRDGLTPFDHVRKVRFHQPDKTGQDPADWVLSPYACFVLAGMRNAVDAELYFGIRTTEFRRTILRCQHYKNGEHCPNVGTRLEWGVTFCSEHMPLAREVLRLGAVA